MIVHWLQEPPHANHVELTLALPIIKLWMEEHVLHHLLEHAHGPTTDVSPKLSLVDQTIVQRNTVVLV
jgi:hypothetical protein